MAQKKSKKNNFKNLLEKYLDIKGLDIILVLEDGDQIELFKNRKIVNDVLITSDKFSEKRIPLSKIKAVDLYAA
jgi:hypothetical protein